MKKIILIICFLFLTTSAFAQKGPENFQFPFIGKINNENVHIRSGPDVSFDSLGRLKKGESIIVFNKRNSWYKVKIPAELSLYINSKFISPAVDNSGVVNANNVNLRSKPDINSTIVSQAFKGEFIEIREKIGEWLKIKPTDNCFGWIKQEFLDYSRPTQIPVDQIPVAKETKQEVKPQILSKKILPVQDTKELPATAKGILQDCGKLIGKKSYPKLVDETGKTIFYLDANKKVLDNFSNNRVTVWGEIIIDKNFSAPIIRVQKIVILE
jgi:uncharacterized protein YgiM (DUF1202 family)